MTSETKSDPVYESSGWIICYVNVSFSNEENDQTHTHIDKMAVFVILEKGNFL